jgi:hypothetical protein
MRSIELLFLAKRYMGEQIKNEMDGASDTYERQETERDREEVYTGLS